MIIPNWNGRQHLATCLSSLRAQEGVSFEIILVDNGSTDGSQAFIRDEFEEVKLLELEKNQGFTGACIAGYQQAEGEFVVLLNNDTEVTSSWLAKIVDAFRRHPEVGIVASKMLLFDSRDHFHTAGDYYRVDGIPGNRGVWQQDTGQYDREEYVFSACGGSAAYRRSMIQEIGFLDEYYYFSCEDTDLSWRAQLSGWKVLYVPEAIVYHKLQATGGDVTASYYDGRNFIFLILKNYPSTLLRKYWPSILRAQLNISWMALKAWRGEAARARLRGQVAGLIGGIKILSKRHQVQTIRRVSDDSLTAVLTPVDESP